MHDLCLDMLCNLGNSYMNIEEMSDLASSCEWHNPFVSTITCKIEKDPEIKFDNMEADDPEDDSSDHEMQGSDTELEEAKKKNLTQNREKQK